MRKRRRGPRMARELGNGCDVPRLGLWRSAGRCSTSCQNRISRALGSRGLGGPIMRASDICGGVGLHVFEDAADAGDRAGGR
jgi:hypothetical protein